jgi:hypothetical protein
MHIALSPVPQEGELLPAFFAQDLQAVRRVDLEVAAEEAELLLLIR